MTTLTAEPGIHPAALLFPPMTTTEYGALVASIREDGQLEAIVMHEGQILDGRHRWRACRELGIEPQTRAYMGECGTPLRFVIAENLTRRHLSTSQAAACAVEALPLFEAEAKEAQRRAGGSKTFTEGNAPLPQEFAEAVQPQSGRREAREARGMAGAAFGTSRESVRKAAKVAEQSPDLFAEVKAGTVTVDAATKELRQQQAIAEQAESDRLFGIVGDPEGRIAKAQLRSIFSHVRSAVSNQVPKLDIEATAQILDESDWQVVLMWTTQTRMWLDRIEKARPVGLRLIGGYSS